MTGNRVHRSAGTVKPDRRRVPRIHGLQASVRLDHGQKARDEQARVQVPSTLLAWVEGLADFGPAPLVRAALALAQQQQRALGKDASAPEAQLFAAVRAWLQEPGREQARAVLRLAEDLAERADLDPAAERAALAAGSSRKQDAQRYAIAAARWLLAWRTCERADLEPLARRARELDRLLANPSRASAEALGALGLGSLPRDEPSLREVVAQALVPAALGPLAVELGLEGPH